jgi:hypothetical protein
MTAVARPHPRIDLKTVWNGGTRAGIVVFGGLLVLQSSGTLDGPKIVYLALAVAAAIGAAVAVSKAAREGTLLDRTLPVASVLLIVFLAVSLPVALMHGTPPTLWLRDAATYGLFGSAVFLAVDLERSATRKLMLTLFLVAGILATIGFTIEWMDRRDIMRLSLPWIPLPSGALPSALFATASAFALRSDRRLGWAALAGILLASFLLLGTRSRLPFVALPILLAVMSGRARWRDQLPSLLVIGLSTAVFFSAATLALNLASGGESGPTTPPPVNAGELGDRIGSVGDLVRNPAGDPSFQERVAQTKAAWNVFVTNPILGTGPGYEISWTNFIGQQESGYYLDTPMMEVAKFGIVGLALGLVWIAAFALFVRDGYSGARESPEVLALIGFSAILVYSLPLSPPTHDKGTALALTFLIALVLRASRRERSTRQPAAIGADS